MQIVIQKGKQTNNIILLQSDKTLFADACTYYSEKLNYGDNREIILLLLLLVLLSLQAEKILSV
jgi:hypothetical protein